MKNVEMTANYIREKYYAYRSKKHERERLWQG